ncbi:MAG TPA: hypothetical protein VFF73_41015 [Planctomycetota bacterium]|nr:hypothetical protein [Planctomycetota bacterium]
MDPRKEALQIALKRDVEARAKRRAEKERAEQAEKQKRAAREARRAELHEWARVFVEENFNEGILRALLHFHAEGKHPHRADIDLNAVGHLPHKILVALGFDEKDPMLSYAMHTKRPSIEDLDAFAEGVHLTWERLVEEAAR